MSLFPKYGSTILFYAILVQQTMFATDISHRFAGGDYFSGQIFIVDNNGKIEWKFPAPNCNDLWVLPSGNILFNTTHSVLELTKEKKTVFEYKSKGEISACQRLSNGNTFVGETSEGRLLEVDPAGKIVKEIKLLPDGKGTKGGHAYMRNARVLPNGNYLCAHYGPKVVCEYDPQGKLVLEIKVSENPHSLVRLPNGNTLISLTHTVIEVDSKGKTVWEISNADLPPEIRFKLMTGLHRLPNGNTVLSNYLGHNDFGKAPHLIEVTPDKKVVWTFADHTAIKAISTVQILDEPLDCLKGMVLH